MPFVVSYPSRASCCLRASTDNILGPTPYMPPPGPVPTSSAGGVVTSWPVTPILPTYLPTTPTLPPTPSIPIYIPPVISTPGIPPVPTSKNGGGVITPSLPNGYVPPTPTLRIPPVPTSEPGGGVITPTPQPPVYSPSPPPPGYYPPPPPDYGPPPVSTKIPFGQPGWSPFGRRVRQ